MLALLAALVIAAFASVAVAQSSVLITRHYSTLVGKVALRSGARFKVDGCIAPKDHRIFLRVSSSHLKVDPPLDTYGFFWVLYKGANGLVGMPVAVRDNRTADITVSHSAADFDKVSFGVIAGGRSSQSPPSALPIATLKSC